MLRFVLIFVLAVSLLPAAVQAESAQTNHCAFHGKFAELRDLVGHGIVGYCLGNADPTANGDVVQNVSGGLMVLRASDNRIAFTDGAHTWLIGPHGLAKRLNSEVFDWESVPASIPTPIPLPSPQPTPTPAPDSDLPQRPWHEWYADIEEQGWGSSLAKYSWKTVFAEKHGIDRDSYAMERYVDVFTAHFIVAPFLASKYLEAGYDIYNGPALYEFYLHMLNDYTEVYCFIRPILSREQQLWIRNVFEAEAQRRAGNEWTNTAYAWASRHACGEGGTDFLPPTPTPTPVPNVLEQAAEIMSSTSTGAGLYQSWVDSGAIATWEVLENDNYYAIYRASDNRIVFNLTRYDDFSLDMLAAVLAHEIIHAWVHQVGRGGEYPTSQEECELEEVLAYTVGLVWWHEKFGVSGKSNPNEMEAGQNRLMEAWLHHAARNTATGLSDEEALMSVLRLIQEQADGTHHVNYCGYYADGGF